MSTSGSALKSGKLRAPRRFSLVVVLASTVVVLVHALLVWSFFRQPLFLNQSLGVPRSPVWALHNDMIHRSGPGADFFAVYHSGLAARTGLDPYAPAEIPRVTPYWFSFRYLPAVAQTLGRAVSLLPPERAYHAWLIVIEASLWALLLVLWRSKATIGLLLGTSAALLLSSPYLLELHMGQFTFVSTTMSAIALLLLACFGAS